MNLPANQSFRRLPKRFPVGARYVVEGRSDAHDALRVLSRYVLLPDGRRIDVPVDSRPAAKRRLFNSRQSQPKEPDAGTRKKFAAAVGTE
jgi:hypothetical protein